MAAPSKKLGIAKEHDVDDLDAEKLLERVEGIAREIQKERANIAVRNERWYHGDQWSADEYPDESTWGGEWDSKLPTIEDNLLPNAADTAVARLLEMQPVNVWFPSTGTGASPIVAQVANRINEHYNQALGHQQKLRRTCLLAFFGGSAGLKLYWNAMKGPYTASTDPDGDLSLDVVSLLDFSTDGAEDIEDARWLYHTRLIDKHDAYALMRSVGYSKAEAKEETFRAVGRNDPEEQDDAEPVGWRSIFSARDTVRASELWWLPGSMIPEGRFCSYIGKKVVENMEFPYDHEELPLAIIKWREITGSPHGSTPMDSMVKLQRAHNEALSIRTRRVYEFRHNWVWAHPQVVQQMRSHSALISRPDEDAQKPEVITAKPEIEGFEKLIDDTAKALDGQAGIPAILSTGQGFSTSTVGKAMGYLNYVVQLKTIGILWQVFTANARIDRQKLELVQQHFSQERLVALLGPGSEMSAQMFLEADLEAYAILPQPGHGDMLSRVARASEAQAAVAEGSMDPARGAELGQTGLTQTEDESWHVQQIHAAAQTVLQGGEAIVPDDVDAGIAIRELRRLVPTYADAAGADGLVQMLQHFEGELAAPPPAGGPQPEQPQPIEEMSNVQF